MTAVDRVTAKVDPTKLAGWAKLTVVPLAPSIVCCAIHMHCTSVVLSGEKYPSGALLLICSCRDKHDLARGRLCLSRIITKFVTSYHIVVILGNAESTFLP